MKIFNSAMRILFALCMFMSIVILLSCLYELILKGGIEKAIGVLLMAFTFNMIYQQLKDLEKEEQYIRKES